VTAGDDIRRGGARFGTALVAVALGLAMLVGRAGAAEPAGSAQSLGIHYAKTGFTRVEARADGGVVAQQGTTLRSYLADGSSDPAAAPREAGEGKAFAGLGGKSFRLERGELTRLDADGTPDGSFGSGGKVKAPFAVDGVVELPSRKVDLITFELEGAREARIYIGVTILNADGSTVRSEDALGSIGASDVFQPIDEYVPTGDGGSLVVGRSFLLELRPDGSARRGFGEKGIVNLGRVSEFVAARPLPDGSIAAAGAIWNTTEQKNETALARYTAAGKPDASFGAKGVRTFGLGGFEGPFAASWGPDGSVVLGGRTMAPPNCTGQACDEVPALAAFDPAGDVQTSFGEGGVLRLAALAGPPQEVRSSQVAALARRPDGSIVAVGSGPPNRSVAFLAALSPEGSLLPSFGEGGIVATREPVPATERVAGLAPLEDGGALAAANTDVGAEMHPALVRYAADGSLDQAFGGGTGFVSLAEGGIAMGIAVSGEEALVGVWGKQRNSLLLRNVGDGSPVASFGEGGVVNLPQAKRLTAPALAPDGDPVVLLGPRSGRGAVVERLGTDGRLDPFFGHGGKVALRVPGKGEVGAYGTMLVTPSGQVLVGFDTGKELAVASLLPDGRLDRHFGAGGWSVTNLAGKAGSIHLALAGRKLYVAGNFGGATRHVVLARLDARGHPDRGFGHGGSRVAGGSVLTRVTSIEPTSAGVLVTIERSPRPLLVFGKDGAVRRRVVGSGSGPWRVGDVQATLSAGLLIVGWAPYLDNSTKDPTYHLASLAVDG
jgi:uncharacterized delta-60 repeat protein